MIEGTEAVRDELERLRVEFDRSAGRCKPLYHQRLWAVAPMSAEAWGAFVASNGADEGGGHWWDVPPDGEDCGRVRGDEDSWEEFQRLAASGTLLLRAFGLLPGAGGGHHAWLRLVYETAASHATALLRLGYGRWGVPAEATCADLERLARDPWTSAGPGGVRFPSHPFVQTLQHDLFRSSAEAIRLWLDPDRAVTIGVPMCDPPLTLHVPAEEVRSVEEDEVLPDRPVWHGRTGRREFWVGNRLIKKYNQPAANQEAILGAFQDDDWPDRIDDPITGAEEVDSKRRLRDAVEALNENHKATEVIRFHTDGTGEGVTWELLI